MPISDVLRDFLVRVTYQVDPASEKKLNTSLTGSVLKANLLSQALEGFARTFVQSIGRAIDNLEKLNVVAARTNTTVDAIRNMQYAARKMGADMGSATAALEAFQQQINKNPNYERYWQGLIPDLKGLTDTSDKLMKIFEYISKQPRWRAEALNKDLGLGIPPDLFDVIMKQFSQYRDALREHDKIMKSLGVSQRDAARASFELHQAWTKFGTVFDAFFVRATNTLLPEFNKKLNDIIDTTGKSAGAFDKFFDGFDKAVPKMVKSADMVSKAFGGWSNLLMGIGAMLAGGAMAALPGVAGAAIFGLATTILGGGGIMTLIEQFKRTVGGPKGATPATPGGGGTREDILKSLGMGERTLTDDEKRIQKAVEDTAKNTGEMAKGEWKSKNWEWTKNALGAIWRGGMSMLGMGGGGEGGGGGGEGGYAGAARRMRGMGGGTGAVTGGGATGAGGPVNVAQAYQYAKQAGATDEQARTLAAIAMAESRGNPRAWNQVGESSVGLWQINRQAHGNRFGSVEDLMDPQKNAKAAVALMNDRIRRGHNAFADWTTYTSGKYARYMPSAGQLAGGGATGGGDIKTSDLSGGAAQRGWESSVAGLNPDLRARTGALLNLARQEGVDLKVTSGVRPSGVNAAVGGARRSQHLPEMGANAVDFSGNLDWAHRNASRVGMHFPIGWDRPHAEVMGNRGWGAAPPPLAGGGGSEGVAERQAKAVEIAAQTVGLKEGPDSATLKKFFQGKLDPDEAAWCSAYASTVMEKAGFKGWGAIATNAAKWGRGVDIADVEPGMVAYKMRGHKPGQVGGHAEIVSGKPWKDKEGNWRFKAYTSGGGGMRGGPHGLGRRLPGEDKSEVLEREEMGHQFEFRAPTARELASNFNNSVTMNNQNTFNMGGGGPMAAVEAASLVGREHERALARARNIASNKTREFIPRVT